MARKAERYNAIAGRNGTTGTDNTLLSVTTGKQYRVALYARLSVEKDGRKSDSIESQFMIMENFIKDKPELSQYQKYFDRGVSGTTFTRPDFVRMMDDVKAGRINCIIVKDLSRFGRDYLETGNYIETILPFLGVRFISVNDHFDTVEDCNGNKGLGISLMNLVNDMYAKDVSKRITTAFESCMERGSVLGNAPYGYDRVKNDDGYQLVIDEPAADIVRRIFQMAKDGMSLRAIAGELTHDGVRTPEGYRTTQLVYVGKDEPFCDWQHGTISKILSNEVYIGTLYQGKTKTNLCTGEKKHRIDKADWIIHEDAHEPIVSKELFMEVRSIVEKRRDKMSCTFREDLPATEDKYKGILKCPVCGDFIHRESSIAHTEQGDVRKYYYRCRHNSFPMEERGDKILISEEQLDLLVSESVRKLMGELVPDKKKLLATWESQTQPVEDKMQAAITDLQKQKERLEYEGSLYYGSYVKGEVTREELQRANEKQAEAVKNLEKKLLQAEKDQKAFWRKKREQKQFVNALLSVKDASVLTAELVKILISEIVLNEDRCMEIKYRFHKGDDANYTDSFIAPKKTRWNEGRRKENG
ncbi:MAG: recombinase family protein [Lachnospiraceae bacterium]|nr:recombinase family protein [Lachnospiraceae bacterium]